MHVATGEGHAGRQWFGAVRRPAGGHIASRCPRRPAFAVVLADHLIACHALSSPRSRSWMGQYSKDFCNTSDTLRDGTCMPADKITGPSGRSSGPRSLRPVAGGPGLRLGQPSGDGCRRPGHLVRRPPGGRNQDLPGGGAGDADTGPAASAGGGRLRFRRRQQQAHRLCGSPRSAACRYGRAGLPGRRDAGRGPVGLCCGGPGSTRRRRARGDRSSACPPAAASGLITPRGSGQGSRPGARVVTKRLYACTLCNQYC